MVTGIKANDIDLDSIFEPRTTPKIADTNIHSNGDVDIANRFEDKASWTPAADATNIHKGDADLNTLFAAIGTVGGAEVITLSGTSGSPIPATDFGPSPSQGHWSFEITGQVWRKRTTGTTQYLDGTSWTDFQDSPGQDYWIYANNHTGSNPNNGSSALNTWIKVAGSGASNVIWKWYQSGSGSYSGAIRVRISTDASGSPVVATGYYSGSAIVENN
jgi:hypothetical protein